MCSLRCYPCYPQPNSRLLVNYGIVDENNPYDKLQMTVSVPNNDPLYQRKRALLHTGSLSSTQVLGGGGVIGCLSGIEAHLICLSLCRMNINIKSLSRTLAPWLRATLGVALPQLMAPSKMHLQGLTSCFLQQLARVPFISCLELLLLLPCPSADV